MKKLFTILLISIFLISIVGASYKIKQEKIENSRIFNKIITRCKKDSDCYITTSTCCPCNSGGEQIAVNRFGLRYYDKWKKNNCEFPQKCQMVYNCYYEKAVCEGRECVLK